MGLARAMAIKTWTASSFVSECKPGWWRRCMSQSTMDEAAESLVRTGLMKSAVNSFKLCRTQSSTLLPSSPRWVTTQVFSANSSWSPSTTTSYRTTLSTYPHKTADLWLTTVTSQPSGDQKLQVNITGRLGGSTYTQVNVQSASAALCARQLFVFRQ